MPNLSMNTILAGLLLGLCWGSAHASPERYRFDKVHSDISFSVSHLGFSMSQGEFHDWDGSFSFDPENWDSASVEVAIKVESLDMDNATWNRAMLGPKYFNAKAHPLLRFSARGLKRSEASSQANNQANRGTLSGELELLGISRPVVLDVVFNRVGVHPYSGLIIAGFSATTRIKRSDFGMTEAIPGVGDEIQIRLEIEGSRAAKRRTK